MKRNSQSMIAAITFMAIGHSVSAQKEVVYDFNTDLAGVFTEVNAGAPAVGVIAGLTDNGVPNNTKVLRQQTASGLSNQTCVNDLVSIPKATNYSITWKEYITALPNSGAWIKKGFLLRGTGLGTYASGIKNGYYLMVQNNASGSVTFMVRNAADGAVSTLGSSAGVYLDGGKTPMTPLKAYWYRVSIKGFVIKFEYSLDGKIFNVGYTYTDTSNLYPFGGLTQAVCGIGGTYTSHYIDDIKFNN
ncbi:DUF1349 domain-containing protein [Flavobacterium flavipallidum]|uniref:Uncharacterized protein n=1 Tax=Flavobacterium flavipallidum TaxID=3139140 RepID=A0ABU9HQ13_9FLAO